MEKFLKILEPRSTKGLIARVLFVVLMVVAANFTFSMVYGGLDAHDASFYFTHAITVGGPFVTFFFFVMTHQIKLQRELSLLSRKDGLTGLNNRRTFLKMTELRQKESKGGVLLLLDADKFKRINDTYGHSVGDDCLKAIAYRLQRNVRDIDVVGRLGGEEFAIFLAQTTIAQARVIGERLTQPVPFQAGPGFEHLSVTLSVGAVVVTPDRTLDSLLARADEALYQAKGKGRAQLVVWEGESEIACDEARLPVFAH